MTYEDVKRIRQNMTTENVDNAELSRMIDAAIEKQIPKKTHKNYDKLSARWCDCGWYVGSKYDDFKYCANCGQAIDWSGGNEQC